MYVLANPQTGKELRVSPTKAKEVFGVNGEEKRFICLPCKSEIVTAPSKASFIVQVKTYARKKKIHGTCVIRMGGLGDLILLSSGLKELRKRMKGVPLYLATLKTWLPFMKKMDCVDRCIPIDNLGGYEFTKVIDLRFAVEPPQLGASCKGTWESYTTEDRSDVFDKLLGTYPAPKRFQVPVNGSVSKLSKLLPEKFILLNACMVSAARSIPPVYIQPICELITEKLGIEIVLCGTSEPWNASLKTISIPKVTNLIDQTTIWEMIALCSMAHLVITPDTGTLHVAGAMGKRTLGIFGNINPRTRISYYSNVKALYPHGELRCIPCWDIHPCMKKPEDGAKCMRLITPQKILAAVEQEFIHERQVHLECP